MADVKKIMQGTTYRQQSKYQWPASRLSPAEMAILAGWRKRTGLPINELLPQAVRELHKIIQRG